MGLYFKENEFKQKHLLHLVFKSNHWTAKAVIVLMLAPKCCPKCLEALYLPSVPMPWDNSNSKLCECDVPAF